MSRILSLLWRLLNMLGAPTAVVRDPLPESMRDLSPHSVGLDYMYVDIETELGQAPAWRVPALSNKWVIFIHGRGGERVGSLDMLPFMARENYTSLVITHRNDLEAPNSPDGRDHLGATEWRDLEAAVEYAVRRGADEVVLFARSAGGSVVGQFLSKSAYAPLISKVVLDNPVLDWRAVFMNAKPRWMPRLLADLIIWGNMRKISARISQFNWAKEPPLYRPPVLILHAKDDEVCPIEASEKFLWTRPESWRVHLVRTGGGHAGGRFDDPELYLSAVSQFLREPERPSIEQGTEVELEELPQPVEVSR